MKSLFTFYTFFNEILSNQSSKFLRVIQLPGFNTFKVIISVLSHSFVAIHRERIQLWNLFSFATIESLKRLYHRIVQLTIKNNHIIGKKFNC